MYLITPLSDRFTSMEALTDGLHDLYMFALEHEFSETEKIQWFSIGYEQKFGVGASIDGDVSRRSLISILPDDSPFYELLDDIETGLGDGPFFTALLSTIVLRLQLSIQKKFKGRLQEDFHTFVWTNDERYYDPNAAVPNFDLYPEDEAEKEELMEWVKSFCKTEGLRNYLVDLLTNKFSGSILSVAKKHWN